MQLSRGDLLCNLAADPVLGEFSFELIEVAGLEALVARLVPPGRSVALWRAACAHAHGFWPVLTDDLQVHPHIEPVRPAAAASLDLVRAARKRVVRASPEAAAAFDAITHALPQAEPYDERDSFLPLPGGEARISLVLVRGDGVDAVAPFTPDGAGTSPRRPELRAVLEHWRERHGAEPLYADGARLELDVQRPPRDLDELRSLARDAFLLSQGTCEGYGIEAPARLLRRLMSDRWVMWWYGTT